MRISRNFFLVIAILIAFPIYGMQDDSSITKDTAVFFDLDGVITGGLKVQVGAVESDLMYYSIRYPFIHAALQRNPALIDKQLALINEEATLEYNHRKAGLLYAVMPMIECAQDLRAQGCFVLAATNQSNLAHEAYSKILLDHHDINIDDIFHARLTTNSRQSRNQNGSNQSSDDGKSYYRLNEIDNIYVMKDPAHRKPKPEYYQGLMQLVHNLNPKIKKGILIDDLSANIEGIENLNKSEKTAGEIELAGIHFNLPRGNVLWAEPEELEEGMLHIKAALKAHGISIK